MEVKVSIPGDAIHGISRVVEAQIKYLPEFGITITESEDADVIVTHGATRVPVDTRQPILNVNHGLYWSRYGWGANYQEVNKMVVDAMVQAKAHTVPSEWVGVSVRRGGLFYPEVVYHGIDAAEWAHTEQNQGYILWNKARADYVSNPKDMTMLASRMPNERFVSTIGKGAPNVTVTGAVPYERMKKMVQGAGLYLCTARETFGIGTLEALASGVPVVGWDWGGQSEIIIQGETGYLATPGDYEQLSGFVHLALSERERLSNNAIADARERWAWQPRIKQYAQIIKRLHTFYNVQTRPKVTVIVTAYKLDQYLPKCLESVQKQTFEDFECLVVDDALLDSTRDIVEAFCANDRRFTYLRPPENLGLPEARNFGFSQAKGLFIRHLDADDWLSESALALEVEGLEARNDVWIGYGPMENVDEEGHPKLDGDGNVQRWAHHEFSWRQQMSHINQIPSCSMVRREVFDRSGGYRKRMKKAEDAHFNCLVTSNGFRARKITDETTMYHRVHKESKGMKEWEADKHDGDWTAWFPWRFGADTYGKGAAILNKLGMSVPSPELVPFSVDAPPPPGMTMWGVNDYSYPVVSIIVTVGPGYERFIKDCLDSIAGQTFPDWECIVVNDTGKPWNQNHFDSPLCGYPWAKEVYTGGNYGVSRARNLGAEHAKSDLLIWFDVDDIWIGWFLERMIGMYEVNQGIIYSDVLFSVQGSELTTKPYKEFNCHKLIETGVYPGSSVIVPKWVHEQVVEYQGGWDEEIPGMEDWDYQLACHAITKVCAYHLEEALFIYRYRPDGNREKHAKLKDEIVAYMNDKWADYRNGEKKMACGCNKKRMPTAPTTIYTASGAVQEVVSFDANTTTVDLRYLGTTPKLTYRGKVTGQTYVFGSLPSYMVRRVYVSDAREFLLMNVGGKPIFVVSEETEPVSRDVRDFLLN